MLRIPAKLVLLLLLVVSQAWGWGGAGHRITGYIAEPLLSVAARQQLKGLLGEESLATATTYMDVQRQLLSEHWPEAARWHYDNQPVCGAPIGYCSDGNCATHQLERWQKTLADRHAGPAQRALALRIVVHLLGDIHQPLHMADNHDRGGNDIWVRLAANEQRHPLHEVMDTLLIKELMGRQRIAQYANQLRTQYRAQFNDWQRGTPNEWASQTHQLAVTHSYRMLPGFACGVNSKRTLSLSRDYVQDASQYLPEQLAKAGVRIAVVLNATLR